MKHTTDCFHMDISMFIPEYESFSKFSKFLLLEICYCYLQAAILDVQEIWRWHSVKGEV